MPTWLICFFRWQVWSRVGFWLVCLIIGYFSVIPSFEDVPQVFIFWDKAQHFLAYAGLCVIGWWAYPRYRRVLIFALVAYGGSLELLQTYLPYRYGDWFDFVANTLGVLVVSAAAYLYSGWQRAPR